MSLESSWCWITSGNPVNFVLLVPSFVKWDNYCLVGCLWDIIENRWCVPAGMELLPDTFIITANTKFHWNKRIRFDSRILFLSLSFLTCQCGSDSSTSQRGFLPLACGSGFFSLLPRTGIFCPMWAVSPQSSGQPCDVGGRVIKTTWKMKIKSPRNQRSYPCSSSLSFQTTPAVLMVPNFFWVDIYPEGVAGGTWQVCAGCFSPHSSLVCPSLSLPSPLPPSGARSVLLCFTGREVDKWSALSWLHREFLQRAQSWQREVSPALGSRVLSLSSPSDSMWPGWASHSLRGKCLVSWFLYLEKEVVELSDLWGPFP